MFYSSAHFDPKEKCYDRLFGEFVGKIGYADEKNVVKVAIN